MDCTYEALLNPARSSACVARVVPKGIGLSAEKQIRAASDAWRCSQTLQHLLPLQALAALRLSPSSYSESSPLQLAFPVHPGPDISVPQLEIDHTIVRTHPEGLGDRDRTSSECH